MIFQDIEIIEYINQAHVRAGFSGAYQQPGVKWEADIMSLEYYQSQHPGFVAKYGKRTALMEVDWLDSDQRRIVIALPVAEITDAEINKTVMMVRNYRLMTVGLRQWSG